MISDSIVAHKILLASILAMAASEASAKPISVISIGNIPVYSLTPSIQWIETLPANSRMCIESEPMTFKGGRFLQLLLEGQKVYTPLPVNRKIFAPDPAGDKSCMSQAASTTLPANIPPAVQRAPQPAPNYVSPPTMAASGSAYTPTANDVRFASVYNFAAIVSAPVPYYKTGKDDVNFYSLDTTPPLGQFVANQHVCVSFVLPIVRGGKIASKVASILLPGSASVKVLYSAETFIPDPPNNRGCEVAAGQYNLEQSHNEKPVSPESPTDPAMQADIKVFLAANPSRVGHTGNSLQNEIGDFFYTRGSLYYDGGSDLPDLFRISEWSDQKDSQDFVKASRWYQLVISQVSAANPELVAAPGAVCPPYPSPSHPSHAYCDDFFHAKWMIGKCGDQLSSSMLIRRKEANDKYRKGEEDKAAAADIAGRVKLHWNPIKQADPLSGNVTLELEASEKDATGEIIQGRAACNNTVTLGTAVLMVMTGAKESPIEDIEFRTFTGDKGTNLLWNDNKVSIRYRVGLQEVQTINAPLGNFTNSVTIQFLYSDMSSAQNFAIELPLANGHTPVVEINPKDDTLRAFTEVCEKQADQKDMR